MRKESRILIGILVTCNVLIIAGCKNSGTKVTAENDTTSVTAKNEADTATAAWISLFDGKTLDGWHGYNKTGEIKNWTIEDSAMVCLGVAQGDTGGDIVTDREFEDFELTWEWKITKGGNSGVMYHVVETTQYKAPFETGPEYQVIDDMGYADKLEESQKAGADYGMYQANEKKKLMPVGEWNTSKIVFDKGHVEHWLNGEKVVEFQAWSDEWKKKVKEGKWNDYPGYGTAKKGKIALQDHGHKVYYKNILIREIKS